VRGSTIVPIDVHAKHHFSILESWEQLEDNVSERVSVCFAA
jgi:hypothetical protein